MKLYMDHHVEKAITRGLHDRGVDVFTALEDGTSEVSDSDLLDRATALNRVRFTRDDDLLKEATKRRRNGIHFAGVIFAHLERVPIGTCIRDLELIVGAPSSDELTNLVRHLPL